MKDLLINLQDQNKVVYNRVQKYEFRQQMLK